MSARTADEILAGLERDGILRVLEPRPAMTRAEHEALDAALERLRARPSRWTRLRRLFVR